MLGPGGTAHPALELGWVVGQVAGVDRTQNSVFDDVFFWFLVIGTVVGIVVIGYTLYNAYRYREENVVEKADVAVTGDDAGDAASPEDESGDDETTETAEFDPYADDPKVTRPKRGELPTGSGGGRKLFLSFGISAIIVLVLIGWTYGLLQFVEAAPDQADAEDKIIIDVEGERFAWTFQYPNGESQVNELRVPANQMVQLNVTSTDVFHNLGSPGLRFKVDAIPGQVSETWFISEDTGTYSAHCYELCGAGHATMDADIVVMEPDAYQEWYESELEGS